MRRSLENWIIAICLVAVGAAMVALATGAAAMPTPAPDVPVVSFVQPEQTLVRVAGVQVTRGVVASWEPACDALGCADLYERTWRVGVQSDGAQSGGVRTDTLTRTTDTLRVEAPPPGDSLTVEITVVAYRRGLASQSVTSRLTLRTPDAPPPPPSGLKLDTIPLETAAIKDSVIDIAIEFDTWQQRHPDTPRFFLTASLDTVWRADSVPTVTVDTVAFDSLRPVTTLREGYVLAACANLVWVGTEERVTLIPSDLTDAQADEYVRACRRGTAASRGVTPRRLLLAILTADSMFTVRGDSTRVRLMPKPTRLLAPARVGL